MAKKILFILSFLFFIAAPISTYAAASISFSPSGDTVSVGERITVRVTVATDTPLNAISGDITIPPSSFTIESVSKSGSVLNFWVTEPSISRTTGVVHFEGVILNGFQGTGTVLTFVIRPTTVGTSTVSFSNAQILANDGEGTNITGNLSRAVFTIEPAKTLTPKEVIPPVDIPTTEPVRLTSLAAPIIRSSTHPDSTLWYSNNNVRLQWSVPKGVVGIRTLLNSQSDSIPQGNIEKISTERLISDLKDGISYFHLRFIAQNGASETSTYTLRIDNESPTNLSATVSQDINGSLTASISAQDGVSGIDYFLVSLNGKEPEKISQTHGQASYTLPRYLPLGEHVLIVAAYDNAHNRTEITVPVVVDRIPQPHLQTRSRFLIVGGTSKILGTYALPKEKVSVYIKEPTNLLKTYLVTADDEGSFSIGIPLNLPGSYTLWTDQSGTDIRTVVSEPPQLHLSVRGRIFYHVFRIIQIATPFVLVVIIIAFISHLKKQKNVTKTKKTPQKKPIKEVVQS